MDGAVIDQKTMCAMLEGGQAPPCSPSPSSPDQGHPKGISRPNTRGDPLEGSNPSFLHGRAFYFGVCPVGLVPKASPTGVGTWEPLRTPPRLRKCWCVTPHGQTKRSMGLVPQHNFCFLPGGCREIGLNGGYLLRPRGEMGTLVFAMLGYPRAVGQT